MKNIQVSTDLLLKMSRNLAQFSNRKVITSFIPAHSIRLVNGALLIYDGRVSTGWVGSSTMILKNKKVVFCILSC